MSGLTRRLFGIGLLAAAGLAPAGAQELKEFNIGYQKTGLPVIAKQQQTIEKALLERIWAEQRFKAVLVTHDVAEAAVLADRIIVIETGRIALDLAVDVPPSETARLAGNGRDRRQDPRLPFQPRSSGASLIEVRSRPASPCSPATSPAGFRHDTSRTIVQRLRRVALGSAGPVTGRNGCHSRGAYQLTRNPTVPLSTWLSPKSARLVRASASP